EADEFASALLLPRKPILRDLRVCRLTPLGLAPLKAKWRVSIAALAMRAAQLGLMSQADKARFFIELGARGWRKTEPVAIPLERPQVFRKVIEALRDKQRSERLPALCGGVSREDLLEMAGFTTANELRE